MHSLCFSQCLFQDFAQRGVNAKCHNLKWATKNCINVSTHSAFIIGFSCTVWTKTRFLAGSLADDVLADTILIPPRP